MSFTNKVRTGGRAKVALALAGTVAAAVALSACGGSSSSGASSSKSASAPASHAASVGNPPPEWAANAGGWPAHNYDLSNARNTSATNINATNVSKLKPLWRFKLPYIGQFGAYASNPIVLNGIVYIEDPDSNVYALNQQTGAVMWKHLYKSPTPSGGPNGLALGYGLLFGATENSAFALNPKNGKQVWMHKLIGNKKEGIDMAPQLYDGKVLISTIPGSSNNFYQGGAFGTVYSLNVKTGKTIWSFQTVKAAPSSLATRRSTAEAASGTRPPSTARAASSCPSPIRRRCTELRSSRTDRVAPAQISTRTRSSPPTARRGSCSGFAR